MLNFPSEMLDEYKKQMYDSLMSKQLKCTNESMKKILVGAVIDFHYEKYLGTITLLAS